MSKNEKKSGTHVDRRTFLKGVTAAGLMAAIAAGHPTSAAQSANVPWGHYQYLN